MADIPNTDAPGANRAATLLGVRALNDIVSAIKSVFPIAGGTTTAATAGAATLPANPVGFIEVTLPSGAVALVPYYGP